MTEKLHGKWEQRFGWWSLGWFITVMLAVGAFKIWGGC